MKSTGIIDRRMTLISRFCGQIDRLYSLPLSCICANDTQRNAQLWSDEYRSSGLPFGQTRRDGDDLKALTDAGYLESFGQTRALKHKFTWAGLIACCPADWHSEERLFALLRELTEMQQPIQGYLLCPAARDHWEGKRGAAKIYNMQITYIQMLMAVWGPMGWVQTNTCSDGSVWQLEVTPAGLEVLEEPISSGVEMGCMHDYDAWEIGYEEGVKFTRMTLPDEYTNAVPRWLSAGSAWADIYSNKASSSKKSFGDWHN